MRDCPSQTGLYDPEREHSACGVGFLTRKDGIQSHDVLRRGHEALCAVPHRGGMSSEGVGDGAGSGQRLCQSYNWITLRQHDA